MTPQVVVSSSVFFLQGRTFYDWLSDVSFWLLFFTSSPDSSYYISYWILRPLLCVSSLIVLFEVRPSNRTGFGISLLPKPYVFSAESPSSLSVPLPDIYPNPLNELPVAKPDPVSTLWPAYVTTTSPRSSRRHVRRELGLSDVVARER